MTSMLCSDLLSTASRIADCTKFIKKQQTIAKAARLCTLFNSIKGNFLSAEACFQGDL